MYYDTILLAIQFTVPVIHFTVWHVSNVHIHQHLPMPHNALHSPIVSLTTMPYWQQDSGGGKWVRKVGTAPRPWQVETTTQHIRAAREINNKTLYWPCRWSIFLVYTGTSSNQTLPCEWLQYCNALHPSPELAVHELSNIIQISSYSQRNETGRGLTLTYFVHYPLLIVLPLFTSSLTKRC